MQARNFGLTLVVLTALAIPSFVRAQGVGDPMRAAWAAPTFLLTHQRVLGLTRGQVDGLSLLSIQVHRYQQALRRSPSKPWIVGTLGTTPGEAARQAAALLSADQRAQAQRLWATPREGESV